MKFRTIPGIEGKVFIPDEAPSKRKHPCRDCYACQQCSDDRCRVCRADGQTTAKRAAGPCRSCRSVGRACHAR
jgi:hypothetical protein